MSKMQPIRKQDLQNLASNYANDEKAKVVRLALNKNDISSISSVMQGAIDNTPMFSIDLDTMPVTNQMSSGRCWIFSACNVLREIIAKNYKIANFELSQNYIAFFDKLEKINFFMETVLQELETPLADETLRYLLQYPVGDGGQWDMFVSIVKKYGIVSKTAMPETFQSSHTAKMNSLINTRLRKFTADTKLLYKQGKKDTIKEEKAKCLSECYGMLCSCFGVPPTEFTFEYVDKKKVYHAIKKVKPLDFYTKYLKVDLDNYVGIINGPTKDKPFHKMYTVKYLGNVVDGNPVSFLNLPMNEFKKCIINQMKDGYPVWFGCDCGKDGDRIEGIWDDTQYDFNTTFSMDFTMSKEEMLDTRHSCMNHAMVLTGVNLVSNKSTKWKIENSWGEKVANRGYYTCSDTWFDKYVYQAVVNKKYLTKQQQECLKKKPIMLSPWDPFGSLAD